MDLRAAVTFVLAALLLLAAGNARALNPQPEVPSKPKKKTRKKAKPPAAATKW